MKWIKSSLLLLCLILPMGVQESHADMIPGPAVPEKPDRLQTEKKARVPIYAIASGVVAVTLTISLIALRNIRKRNVK
jgi:hypothetical protein